MTVMRTTAKIDISPCGDAALRVTVDGDDTDVVWAAVHRLAGWLNRGDIHPTVSAVPTYDAVLVEFDPYHTTGDAIMSYIRSWDAAPDVASAVPSGVIDVPVLFGGDAGPDLEWVAGVVGASVAEVVRLVCAKEHLIRCLGGPAASAMTDGPEFGVPVPRLATPRLRVPPGAISVAGRQAVIGPVAAPSGWRQIGRTPLTILRTDGSGHTGSDSVVPYRPGDRVRFFPVDEGTYAALLGVPMRYRNHD
ncbi:putative allophanate hydrolase subunit 1 family protein [Streptomyces himastatinicus ATCC 53653]|uniref:Putative allophanate hydrolase subunit 1 family protein n=1 Tax=Streptomyces himastatinicus ATCC 53653 TaxID=457427 RepID=D9WMK5_9ACTN|nr:carboxyltransferase domain-containing protein [Streptomyces himastatinicus]EFL27871.1 putative allophanate hydrolase subunit 1 family protein [Streptomyces himastatinicus ATCC 53653]